VQRSNIQITKANIKIPPARFSTSHQPGFPEAQKLQPKQTGPKLQHAMHEDVYISYNNKLDTI
jgi:hypothetical protein